MIQPFIFVHCLSKQSRAFIAIFRRLDKISFLAGPVSCEDVYSLFRTSPTKIRCIRSSSLGRGPDQNGLTLKDFVKR